MVENWVQKIENRQKELKLSDIADENIKGAGT